MSATNFPVTTGTTTGTTTGFICLTGIVRPAPQVDIIQRGTHRLVGLNGNVIATLSSNQVNLTALEGQFVTVCGINEGRIEGVISLRVTQVIPVVTPQPQPQPQINLTLLLLLLLLTRFRPFGFGFGFPLGAGGVGGLGGNLGLGGLGGLGGPGLSGLGLGGTTGQPGGGAGFPI